MCIAFMLIEEWRIRNKPENLLIYPCHKVVRWIIYILLALFVVIAFNLGNHSEFIYFAF